jgi:hypothetical protein
VAGKYLSQMENLIFRKMKILYVIVVLVLFNGVMGMMTNVPTHLTDEDQLIFKRDFANFRNAGLNSTPEEEVAVIRKIQGIVLKRIPFGAGIPAYS